LWSKRLLPDKTIIAQTTTMTTDFENILLFKTNIGSEGDVHIVRPVLDKHPGIQEWTIDLDDDDCVLRVTSATLCHSNIIDMMTLHGYRCEELLD